MQWEAFFHRNNDHLSIIRPAERRNRELLDWGLRLPVYAWIASNRPDAPSHGEFGEEVHAADLGRHPIVAPVLFYPDDGRLAADPALLA